MRLEYKDDKRAKEMDRIDREEKEKLIEDRKNLKVKMPSSKLSGRKK